MKGMSLLRLEFDVDGTNPLTFYGMILFVDDAYIVVAVSGVVDGEHFEDSAINITHDARPNRTLHIDWTGSVKHIDGRQCTY